MSEKKRQKKDGEDKNKNQQRMHEVNQDSDKQNASTRSQTRSGSGGAKNNPPLDLPLLLFTNRIKNCAAACGHFYARITRG